MGEKPDDKWTLPLCAEHHRTGKDAQHGTGEREWWERHGIDPLPLCEALYESGDSIEQVFYLQLFGKAWLW